jgi:hypothetical protein
MIWIGPAFRGGYDGLAQVGRSFDPVPGVSVGRNIDDKEVHTHAAPIHSIRRQMVTGTGCLLMHLRGCTHTTVQFLCDDGKM